MWLVNQVILLSFQCRLESIRLLLSSLCPLEAGGRPQLRGWGDTNLISSFVALAASQNGQLLNQGVTLPQFETGL
jgi:hypothetical protein